MHTHTEVGSSDSVTTLADIANIRNRIPALHGVALTEHVHRWSEGRVAELPADIVAFPEREYDLYASHILVLNPPPGLRTSRIEELRDAVLDHGGLMILAHPFRFYPSSLNLLFGYEWHEPGEWPPERLAEHPLFDIVHAVEAWNARDSIAQNQLAEACARARGLPIVGGSDSHKPGDIGRYATEFEDDVRTTAELMAAVRAGRCRPVELTPTGEYAPLARAASIAR